MNPVGSRDGSKVLADAEVHGERQSPGSKENPVFLGNYDCKIPSIWDLLGMDGILTWPSKQLGVLQVSTVLCCQGGEIHQRHFPALLSIAQQRCGGADAESHCLEDTSAHQGTQSTVLEG